MEKMSLYMFSAGFITLAGAVVFYFAYAVVSVLTRTRLAAMAGGPGSASQAAPTALAGVGRLATILAWNSAVFLLLSLLARAIASGRGPFSNMYEFTVSFAAGVTLAYLIVEARVSRRTLGALVLPVALGLMWYASTLPNNVAPLVPALQNNLLLTLHVSVAIMAYGFFAVSFGSASLYLVRRAAGTPADSLEILDEVAYRSVLIGFPAMALVILLGSIWAETAWGSWWSWDPKETASLVTFLIYAAYLHGRIFQGWRGTRTALLLVVGFVAVLFTFFGNLFFGGLHSYSGLRG